MGFKNHRLARFKTLVKKLARVAYKRFEFAAVLFKPIHYFVDLYLCRAVRLFYKKVFPLDNTLDPLSQCLRMEKVAHHYYLFEILIAVYGRDTSSRRAVLSVSQSVFFQAILSDVIRHTDDGARADFEVVGSDLDAFIRKSAHLAHKVLHIDDHTVAHYVDDFGTQNSRRYEVEDKLAKMIYYGMSRIVAALVSNYDVIIA